MRNSRLARPALTSRAIFALSATAPTADDSRLLSRRAHRHIARASRRGERHQVRTVIDLALLEAEEGT